jgi:CRISPR system Cascade subunit CasB
MTAPATDPEATSPAADRATDPEARAKRRRGEFVTSLYALQRDLSSPNRYAAAEARRKLAMLRRSGRGTRHDALVHEMVFACDPPRGEEQVWLATAVLFAQHPHPRPGSQGDRPSIGTAMGQLARDKQGSVARRFSQLVAVDAAGLTHYLRQALQLVGTRESGVDFYRLLDELVVLLGEDRSSDAEARRSRIRLDWARDYSRALRGGKPRHTTTASVADTAQEAEESPDPDTLTDD